MIPVVSLDLAPAADTDEVQHCYVKENRNKSNKKLNVLNRCKKREDACWIIFFSLPATISSNCSVVPSHHNELPNVMKQSVPCLHGQEHKLNAANASAAMAAAVLH